MKIEDRQLIAQLCAARAGLKVDPEKTYFIESRLGPVARRAGYGSIPDMMTALREKREEKLIWMIVESVLVAETAFFRDRLAFECFSEEILPDLANRRAGARPIKVWSAACGAGQEIYSLAMTIEEESAKFCGAAIELFASDLSERALEKAQSGLYTQFEIQRGLPIRRLVRHFEKCDEMWTPSPRLRQMVRWRRANLVGDLSSLGKFDVIFCRGFLGGLIDAARDRVVENLVGALEPDGYLFLDAGLEASGLGAALMPAPERPGLFVRDPAQRAAA